MALGQSRSQIIEGTMSLPSGADAIGLATGGEALDEGSSQQIPGDEQRTEESDLALAQGERRGAAEPVYLSQQVGQDT